MLVHLTAAINDHKHHYYSRITPLLPIILHCSTVLYLHVSTRFDGGNDEWISTISQAFEGFSDFKKIDGGQETDLK